MTNQIKNILVIKLGALGDFVQALGPCAAIRRHHADAHITLLTTAPFVELAKLSGYFDAIWIDKRPAWWRVPAILGLRRRLRSGGFKRVYDLQTADRTNFYFHLIGRPRPEWNGIAPGCSHPDSDPDRNQRHTIERQRGQLAAAGIEAVPLPDLSWAQATVGDSNVCDAFNLAPDFVLLVAGGSTHRPAKRWPVAHFAEIAKRLSALGHQPVLLGGSADEVATRAIAEAHPGAVDLTNRTSLIDIVSLAGAASGAIGNDSGPMHLIAASGCPGVVLFSSESNPALCAPRGTDIEILQCASLDDLDVNAVEAAMRLR